MANTSIEFLKKRYAGSKVFNELLLWLAENEGKHFCKCGCGKPIKITHYHFATSIPSYVTGHNSNGLLGKTKYDLQELRRLYYDENLSCKDIAVLYKTTRGAIKAVFRKFIGLRSVEEANRLKSPKISGKNHPAYKNGKYAGKQYNHNKVNGRLELSHRLILQKELGRDLSFSEKVHHINLNRKDNRLENLVLLDHKTHMLIHHYQRKNNIKLTNKKEFYALLSHI